MLRFIRELLYFVPRSWVSSEHVYCTFLVFAYKVLPFEITRLNCEGIAHFDVISEISSVGDNYSVPNTRKINSFQESMLRLGSVDIPGGSEKFRPFFRF